MKGIIGFLILLIIIGGGLYAIFGWVYPHLKATTNHPILYTFLLFLATVLIHAVFSRENTGLFGIIFGYDLASSLIKAVMK